MPKPARKTIAVDIDEVLVPHSEHLISWYNQKYGTKLTLEDNHSQDPRAWGVNTKEEAIKRVQGFFGDPRWAKTPPFEESVDALKRLSPKYKLIVVTSRDTIMERVTRRWLDQHFKEIFKAAHFAAEYSLDGKSRSKATVCAAIGANYLIDDRVDIVEEVAKVGIQALLFGNYPWNQARRLPERVVRVKNWQEVLEYFENEKG